MAAVGGPPNRQAPRRADVDQPRRCRPATGAPRYGAGETPFKTLYGEYIATTKGQRYPLSDVQFGLKMKKLLPPYKRDRNVRYDVFVRWDQHGLPVKREPIGTLWRLPPLADCRVHFDSVVGATCPWPKPHKWDKWQD